ncbi:MAG: c-type cytochrome [Acidobacteria bacterium]|nr:c-type cytochrome [Acidobacteriota bacterium]
MMRAAVPLLILAAALAAPAQHRDRNPFSAPADFQEGLRLYRLNCGVCHGMEGKSGRGARLAVRKHRHGNSDAELFRIIQNGVSGTEMPGLWMDEDSIWRILLAVRSFEVNAGEACVATPGDASAGRQLYAAQGCAGCHTIGPEGGRLGPDLSAVGLSFSREQLRTALAKPSQDIGARYRTVVVRQGGKAFRGVLLNEDAYSVHLLDTSENLRSFLKSEVDAVEKPGSSLMPAYDGLSEADMDHLLAYLCTLRGAGQGGASQ